MGEIKLSRKAKADLDQIAEYTTRTHGRAQCSLYVNELEDCFEHLAEHPGLGHHCDHVSPGLRQWDQGRHAVFYRERPSGVRIVRILHDRMLPQEHAMDDDE